MPIVSNVVLRPVGLNVEIDVRTARLPDQTPEDDGFDPRKIRKPKNPITPMLAYSNILRMGINNSVLAMPLLVGQGGLIIGPFLMICTGLTMVHTHRMLMNSLNEVARQMKVPYVSYRYGLRLALLRGPPIFHGIGRAVPVLIPFFMIVCQMGQCGVIVTNSAENVCDMMDWPVRRKAVLCIAVPYLLMVHYMKTFKILSQFSLFGTFSNLTGFLCIYISIAKNSDHRADMSLYPHFFHMGYYTGYLLFYFSGINVVLMMDKALPDPNVLVTDYGIISVGIMGLTLNALILGLTGYSFAGAKDINILRSLPYDETLSMVGIAAYFWGITFMFPLVCYPAVQVIVEIVKYWNKEIPDAESVKNMERITRPAYVIVCLFLAYLVPTPVPFLLTVGNFATTFLSLIFPGMMDISLRYPDNYGRNKIILVKDVLLILLGSGVCTYGGACYKWTLFLTQG